ncbi:hypothetical protein BpHYR1_033088 [Brachionus plicatilis]|uniref:Uncharacterized protein n=1 Tax=Brachionus plicatilis TaxID=10195 RepID=A0A3M7RJ21_BRAPC|nr:hypothetical protein BpHYR1_033088 [Brachionus plicatilis]
MAIKLFFESDFGFLVKNKIMRTPSTYTHTHTQIQMQFHNHHHVSNIHNKNQNESWPGPLGRHTQTPTVYKYSLELLTFKSAFVKPYHSKPTAHHSSPRQIKLLH